MSCKNSIGFTLSIVHENETLLSEGYGYQDLENQILVNNETLFSIGSTSKAFSSALSAMAVDQGLLDWSLPLSSSLPSFRLADPFADAMANSFDLFAHKVGLPRHDVFWISGPKVSREEIIPRLKHLAFAQEFREEFLYNNWMVFVAGYLPAYLWGEDWDEAVSRRLFKPLGMERTTTGINQALPLGNVAKCYTPNPNPNSSGGYEKLPDDVNRILDLVAPAGGVHSSANDMAKYLKFHLGLGNVHGEQLVSKRGLLQTYARHFALGKTVGLGSLTEKQYPASFFLVDYGMGWSSGVYRGRRTLSHGGNLNLLFFLFPFSFPFLSFPFLSFLIKAD